MTKLPNLSTWLRTAAPAALTLLVLAAALADKLIFHLPPADATPHHARVREAAAQVPYGVGRWLGCDTPVPPAAVTLLRPNFILSRQYQDVRTGQTATLLIVHCEDARDLIGHYPPICYVAHGWSKKAAVATERTVRGETVPVTDYSFTSTRLERTMEVRIDNFMVLPDGRVCRDMDGVEAVARDHRQKFYGAAQVQVVTDATWLAADRVDVFSDLIAATRPLLDALRREVKP